MAAISKLLESKPDPAALQQAMLAQMGALNNRLPPNLALNNALNGEFNTCGSLIHLSAIRFHLCYINIFGLCLILAGIFAGKLQVFWSSISRLLASPAVLRQHLTRN